MEHRGEIIEQAVRQSGYPVATVAKKMGKSRRWIYLLFQNPNVSIDVITQLGKVIYYDFTSEIQALKTPSENTINDENSDYEKTNVDYWKDKYYSLMEEQNELLKRVAMLEKLLSDKAG
jgi:predicted transcriptional regulator